jgi:pimeloyl-ACP methyl ester carboxylesterase
LDHAIGFAKSSNAGGKDMEMAKFPQIEPVWVSKYPLPKRLNVKCGYITVPESRSPPSGNFPGNRVLRIYFTVVKSLNENPSVDPIVFLCGGPGKNSGDILKAFEDRQVQELLLSRSDFIVFDHRGTGFSEPALFAPEVNPLWSDAFLEDFDADERAGRFVEALLKARDRFVNADVNLAAINTPEIASDLNDLRLALGYEKINLWGISYGTRLALATMRDHPEGIRCAILDSTVPIQVSQYLEAIPNAMHAFNLLFDAAAADPKANAAYPDLRAVFYEVFDRLNKKPALIPAKHPMTNQAIELRLTGEVFIGIFCIGFYSSEAISKMPNRIYQAYRGNYQQLAEILIRQLNYPPSDLPGWSQGMYYCVNCCDDKVTGKTGEEIIKYAQKYPEMGSLPLTEFALGKHITDVAAKWGARAAGPAEHKAVVSDIPTLILAGEFDQNTPSYWGKLAGETLTNSHYMEFPGEGHGAINNGDCALSVINEFICNPSNRPDDKCVRELTGPSFEMLSSD